MNLLLVDDEVVSLQAMMEGVRWKICGVDQVFPAYSVKEAKQIFQREKVDLALLDIEMPEENGIDLLRWIREQETVKNIPCAFLTCHAEFQYAREAIQFHCEDYLLKPLEYSKVEKLVAKMVASQLAVNRKLQMERYGQHWLHQQVDSAKEHNSLPVDGQAVADQVETIILNHLSDKLSVEELAFQAHLNPDYLNRLFKKAKGVSINKYIITQRMRLAMELMTKGGFSPTAAALEVGYQSYANFVNMFKKTYGILPSQVGEKGESNS